MEEKNKDTESKEEQLLNYFESSTVLTAEELNNVRSDAESLQLGREILLCKNAVLKEYSRNAPNVDREWDRFKKKVDQRSSKKRLFVMGSLAGVAATVLILISIGWFKYKHDKYDGTVVFTANNISQKVILHTSSGKELIVNNLTSRQMLSNIGANVVKVGKNGLVYRVQNDEIKNSEMHTLSTPRGVDFEIELADGTKVWLNAESKLEYPSRFVNKERTVKLYGEAYFEVAKDKEHPFIVETGNLKTKVLGTQFNVTNYSANNSHVTLIEGSVEVQNKVGGRMTRIKPGEDAYLQNNGQFAVKDVDIDSYVYWKDGFFYFDNVPLVEIMQSLGRWYNINIVFINKPAMDYKMHYLCDRKGGLSHAVTLLNGMKKAELKIEGNTLYVR